MFFCALMVMTFVAGTHSFEERWEIAGNLSRSQPFTFSPQIMDAGKFRWHLNLLYSNECNTNSTSDGASCSSNVLRTMICKADLFYSSLFPWFYIDPSIGLHPLNCSEDNEIRQSNQLFSTEACSVLFQGEILRQENQISQVFVEGKLSPGSTFVLQTCTNKTLEIMNEFSFRSDNNDKTDWKPYYICLIIVFLALICLWIGIHKDYFTRVDLAVFRKFLVILVVKLYILCIDLKRINQAESFTKSILKILYSALLYESALLFTLGWKLTFNKANSSDIKTIYALLAYYVSGNVLIESWRIELENQPPDGRIHASGSLLERFVPFAGLTVLPTTLLIIYLVIYFAHSTILLLKTSSTYVAAVSDIVGSHSSHTFDQVASIIRYLRACFIVLNLSSALVLLLSLVPQEHEVATSVVEAICFVVLGYRFRPMNFFLTARVALRREGSAEEVDNTGPSTSTQVSPESDSQLDAKPELKCEAVVMVASLQQSSLREDSDEVVLAVVEEAPQPGTKLSLTIG